jgi:hypothetical protein
MSYFKIGRVFTVGGSDATTTVQCGGGDSGTGSLVIPELKKAWGVMRGSATSGFVYFDNSGSLEVANMIAGEVYPCFPRAVTATSGSVYILM